MTNYKPMDVFRWQWKAGFGPTMDRYWCKAGIAIVTPTGVLGDIYWGVDDVREIREMEVDLRYQGNLNDYRLSAYSDYLYYASGDLISLRHSNDTHGPIYIRKGAKRSKVVMMEYAADKLEEAQRKLDSAKWDLQHWTDKIKEIDAAEDLKEVWL